LNWDAAHRGCAQLAGHRIAGARVAAVNAAAACVFFCGGMGIATLCKNDEQEPRRAVAKRCQMAVKDDAMRGPAILSFVLSR
jgi:hypothetical protein